MIRSCRVNGGRICSPYFINTYQCACIQPKIKTVKTSDDKKVVNDVMSSDTVSSSTINNIIDTKPIYTQEPNIEHDTETVNKEKPKFINVYKLISLGFFIISLIFIIFYVIVN